MSLTWGLDAQRSVEGAAEALRARFGARAPGLAMILGSGFGELAQRLEGAASVPFAEIPGMTATTVDGHAGELVAGRLDGVEVLAFAGRFHLYEGHAPERVAFPVRLAHALGARTLLVSNAAGGIRRTFRAGDLMLIHDHINLTWHNPLIGPARAGEPRFPDMSQPYDRALIALLRDAALEAAVPIVEGIYAGVLGPSYETPAEIRMLERLGADAVGMSTIPEVLAARSLGMRVAGVSCITNLTAGLGGRLDHADVLAVTARARERFYALVRGLVRRAG